jgi:hypothetical protein
MIPDTKTTIRNDKLIKTTLDFKGLKVAKAKNGAYLMPTDFDMVFELKNDLFIIGELKYNFKPIPVGQKLALEHFAQRIIKGGGHCFVLHMTHTVNDTTIDASTCGVINMYTRTQNWGYKWYSFEGEKIHSVQLWMDYIVGRYEKGTLEHIYK